MKTHVNRYKVIDAPFWEKIMRSFFIDDLNTGTKTFKEGFLLYDKLKMRWLEASFNLTKWRTNNAELREVIAGKEGCLIPHHENRLKKVLGNIGMDLQTS